MKKSKDTLVILVGDLIDGTKKITRNHWANYLSVTTSTISQWVSGKTFPRPDHLFGILSVLKILDDELSKYLLVKFYKIADTPISELVNENELTRYKGIYSLSQYLQKIQLQDFHYKLSLLPLLQREDTLNHFELRLDHIIAQKEHETIKLTNKKSQLIDLNEKKGVLEFDMPKKNHLRSN